MPLDLQGFYTPPQEFNAFDKVENTMERTRLRQMQIAQQQQTRKAAASRYLSNYINSKDKLTGTNYDPEIIKMTSNAMQQGMELASKGADVSDIQMAINPLVSQINDYQSKAKMYQQNKKQILDYYSKQKGYDTDKVSHLLDQYTFPTDEKTGQIDVQRADHTLQTAIQKINENHLADITTGEGISEYAKNQPKEDRAANVLATDKRGNKTTHKLDVKAANWEMPEVGADGQYAFVPKHDVAVDNGAPIEHSFQQPNGTTVKAPVRLLDQNIFYDMMRTPNIRDYILGQVKQHIKDYKDENGKPIDISSPKAEIVARALAYDALKSETGGVVKTASSNTLSPQQIRINLTGSAYAPRAAKGSGSGSGETTINDVYGKIDNLASSAKKGMGAPLNNLNSDAQSAVLKFARDLTGDNTLGNADIYVKKEDDGRITVRGADKNNVIGYLDYTGTNIAKQADVKAKRAVVGKGNTTQTTATQQPSSTVQRMRELAAQAAKNKK